MLPACSMQTQQTFLEALQGISYLPTNVLQTKVQAIKFWCTPPVLMTKRAKTKTSSLMNSIKIIKMAIGIRALTQMLAQSRAYLILLM